MPPPILTTTRANIEQQKLEKPLSQNDDTKHTVFNQFKGLNDDPDAMESYGFHITKNTGKVAGEKIRSKIAELLKTENKTPTIKKSIHPKQYNF